MSKVNFGILPVKHYWHDTTVFAQSLSNFPYKLFVMRGGTLMIFGHFVKVNLGTLPVKPCGHNFSPITLKDVDDELRKSIEFRSRGQRSRSTLALCL